MYEDYIEIFPNKCKRIGFGVNILENGKININGKLRKEIGEKNIRFKYGKSGKSIVIFPCKKGEGFSLNKAGTFKNSELVEEYKRYKMIFPVHYDVELENDVYCGVVSETYKKEIKKK